MWVWIGVGSALIVLLLVALIWICRIFNIHPGDRLSQIKYVVQKQSLKNVTLTLKREVTNIHEYSASSHTSPVQSYDNPDFSYVDENNEDEDLQFINSRSNSYFKFNNRKSSVTNHLTSITNENSNSSSEALQSRSMSHILWQDLTMTTRDNSTIETGYKQTAVHSNERVSSRHQQRREYRSSKKVFRQAWGKKSMKIFLFAKLVAGYFTVNRSGRLCKVNDWRHVSGKDLRYREKAIYELVCMNELEIEVPHHTAT